MTLGAGFGNAHVFDDNCKISYTVGFVIWSGTVEELAAISLVLREEIGKIKKTRFILFLQMRKKLKITNDSQPSLQQFAAFVYIDVIPYNI